MSHLAKLGRNKYIYIYWIDYQTTSELDLTISESVTRVLCSKLMSLQLRLVRNCCLL